MQQIVGCGGAASHFAVVFAAPWGFARPRFVSTRRVAANGNANGHDPMAAAEMGGVETAALEMAETMEAVAVADSRRTPAMLGAKGYHTLISPCTLISPYALACR
jgi:hypothetical protein